MKSMIKVLCALLTLALGSITGHAKACFGGADTLVTTVNRTFSAGSSWSIQVYKAPCEGLVVANALYAPLGLPATKVLTRASVSEIHVPYDNNAARYLDVTVDGSGTTRTPILTESAQSWVASESTSWFVYDKLLTNGDGRNRGYEVRPHLSGTYRGRVNNDEPWSNGELYVTRFNRCELLAARNLEFYLPPSCTGNGPAANLWEMVNGQGVSNQDVVLWYALRHHHVVRDEDEAMMPSEWDGFEIEPRSFSASNPAP